ncbi:MAG: TIGR03032 family protein [Gemmataceae bacterium]|nr:TIGR03032 family protein [Gemmataceae bacterium]
MLPAPTFPAPTHAEQREVRYEHSRDFPSLLAQLGVSVLVSTYQAGKVAVLGTWQGKLTLTFHNFDQPMGLAVSPRRLAVGTRRAIWLLHAAGELAPRIEPAGRHDGAYLTREALFTGAIHCHDLAWCGEELWIVNTLFSCLCTLHGDYSFVPRWRPPFISKLAAEDRCHLNGLAGDGTAPRYLTTLACTDVADGWRADKVNTGCVLVYPTGEVVARGLAMPHSPRLHQGRLWVLDSGRGRLAVVEPASGRVQPVVEVPGYTRGLAFYGQYAFVGLSRIRETNVFGGMPIAERRDELICGLGIIDVSSGRTVATFMFRSGVEEIYDVQVVPCRCLALSGPHPDIDESPVIWVVPPEHRSSVDVSVESRKP